MVHKDHSEDELVWKALADSNRRRILDLLRVRPQTTGEIAASFDCTRFAVMKHLNLLVEAGLVLVERVGRERWNYLNPAPIQGIYRRWIRPFEATAADRLLRLKQEVEQPKTKKPKKSNQRAKSKTRRWVTKGNQKKGQ